MVVHLNGARTAQQVKIAVTARFNELPVHLRLSLTWDQEIEMARHHEFTETTWWENNETIVRELESGVNWARAVEGSTPARVKYLNGLRELLGLVKRIK